MQTSLYVLRKETVLTTDGEKFFLEESNQKREIPVQNIKSLQIFVQIDISAKVFQVCLKNDIPVYFISPKGTYLGKLQPLQGQNVERRIEQYAFFLDEEKKIEKAKELVDGKIKNSLSFLYRQRRLVGFDISEEIEMIVKIQNSIFEPSSLAQIRGREGIVAKYYFQALGKSLPEHFLFTERTRRPPKDKANSLLSFGYTLLANSIMTAVESVGLDAYVGFLHSPIRNNPALVLDMMEEFRSIIVDHLVCSLLFSGDLQVDDFDETGEFPLLTAEGRKKFIIAYEKRLQKEIFFEGKNLKFIWLFESQAEKMKMAIKNNTPYVPFSFR